MTLGFPSIANEAGRSNSRAVESYLAMAMVGVLAGVAVAVLRTPLHLPGHKGIFWILPLLIARRYCQVRWAITLGAIATLIAATLTGGRLAGGSVFALPLMAAAGIVLDSLVQASMLTNRLWLKIAVTTSAGALANAICSLGLLLAWPGAAEVHAIGSGFAWMMCSHSFFGAAAGLCGALILSSDAAHPSKPPVRIELTTAALQIRRYFA